MFWKRYFYGAGKILCTILIGNIGFSGIAAAANENGSDGTVRVSAANLNATFYDVDFAKDPLKPALRRENSNGQTAFGILSGENHSTITFKDNGPKNEKTFDYILRALTVTDKEFDPWCKELSAQNQKIVEQAGDDRATHQFQNTVFFVTDQFDQHVQDYFLEFYTEGRQKHILTGLFYEDVIAKIHAYEADTSFRNVYIDCTILYEQLKKNWEHLHFSLVALPEFKRNKNVGYRTFNEEDMGAIKIPKSQIPKMFEPNRTVLIRIRLRREQADHVFTLKSLAH